MYTSHLCNINATSQLFEIVNIELTNCWCCISKFTTVHLSLITSYVLCMILHISGNTSSLKKAPSPCYLTCQWYHQNFVGCNTCSCLRNDISLCPLRFCHIAERFHHLDQFNSTTNSKHCSLAQSRTTTSCGWAGAGERSRGTDGMALRDSMDLTFRIRQGLRAALLKSGPCSCFRNFLGKKRTFC